MNNNMAFLTHFTQRTQSKLNKTEQKVYACLWKFEESIS